MKWNILKISLVLLTFFCQNALATDAPLFKVSASGSALSITTTPPGRTYASAGIKINTPAFTLTRAGTECTVSPNGYCLFSVSDTQAKNISIAGGIGTINITLCLDGKGAQSCQDYSLNVHAARNAKNLYVLNESFSGPSAFVCPLNASNGNIGTCQDTGQASILGPFVQGITVNNAGTMAYVTSELISVPQLFQCAINPLDGTFSTCSIVNIQTPSNYVPEYGSIVLNADDSIAYIQDAQGSGRIIACSVSLGNINSNCTDTGATQAEQYMTGIALNQLSTTAYIANGYSNNTVTVCTVNDTTMSNCVAKTGGGLITFSSPTDIALNSANTIVYVADSSNVYACSTTANNTSSFDSCILAGSPGSVYGIDVNEKGTIAYVSSNYGTDVYQCPILLDGTFGTCVPNSSFDQTVSLVIGY